MEKFSQFRDRGSGISPFIPYSAPSSTPAKLLHLGLFVFRLPFLLSYVAFYFLLAQHIPLLPQILNKLLVWGLLAIPQVWWGDLQLDGVKRGSLSQQPPGRMPSAPPASLIAANFTSPVDAVYLAAVFDPIFTISYPRSRKVSKVGLWGAIWHALSPSQLRASPPASGLTTIDAILAQNPGRVVAVFPECATTNGQGVMPFSPSLLTAPAAAKIFPVSIRYASPAITTPVPGEWASFLWRLLSRPTHVMRIRIAEAVYNTSGAVNGVGEASGVDIPGRSGLGAAGEADESTKITTEERRVLDRVAENLARLGRNKRVGLTIEDKAKFVEAWKKK
ncbi:acyltransferase [Diaporthe amygdali]|uniref:acyltransferase n=1 Tax=Phomopsis amygdali TaxID=1214568 RepID=UPI0022FF0111|nr:acyltransferase [Diaporthe amygdali]KAJ0108089.1 acyltransferase [Diaporthe amygdali]